jgi:hypothetical protein
VRWLLAASGVLAAGLLLVPARTGSAAQKDDLPDGDGKTILLTACTACHDLTEVTKLRGFYTRTQWRDVIVTMKEYGAMVDDKQVDVLADYLGQNLGKK